MIHLEEAATSSQTVATSRARQRQASPSADGAWALARRWCALGMRALGCILACSCAGAQGREPSNEERLEWATSGRLGRTGGVSTSDDLRRLAELRCEPLPNLLLFDSEEAQVDALTRSLASCSRMISESRKLTRRRPRLQFFRGVDDQGLARDMPALLAHNDSIQAEARLALDRLARDVVRIPLLEHVDSSARTRRVTVRPRVRFAILREAVEVLGPLDKELLLEAIASAEERSKEAAGRPVKPPVPPRPRKRR